MKKWGLILGCLSMATLFFLVPHAHESHNTPLRRLLGNINGKNSMSSQAVRLRRNGDKVVIDNGIVEVTLSRNGDVTGLKYNGIDNLLEIHNEEDNRGYWDVFWNKPNERSSVVDRLSGTSFKVVVATESKIELSFTRTWNVSYGDSKLPLNIDKRYVLQQGSSGFYVYGIFERLKGWPAIEIDQIRIVYKLLNNKFTYMALSDRRQRIMPTMHDRETGRPLAYPEAVLLTNPSIPKLKGEVDDKYQYSSEDEDIKVHGWISFDPPVGFWVITPSDEFRVAGPVKQELTSHVGPISLSMFTSTHYAGKEAGMQFAEGEPWKKVFGPVFIHLNSVSGKGDARQLWNQAKDQMVQEVNSWPYNFPESVDFLKSNQRGTIYGQLLVQDRYIKKSPMPANNAYVGLALPGEGGSWQTESKGYQFWTQTDEEGNFLIKNVNPGVYNLYAWVPGFIGDYKYQSNIIIQPGSTIKLNKLVYIPPRQGPTLWEIGIPDRTAAEFYVPDPNPGLVNRLYISDSHDKFRQYGLWDRYTDDYPNQDLIFTVGVDDYRKSWFYAHVPRNVGNNTYQATTWQIRFQLFYVTRSGSYTLRLALASATRSEIQVRFNNPNTPRPDFTTTLIGRDNAIARHGIHGLYRLYNITMPGNRLRSGKNTIYLTQSRNRSPFFGVMYDYIRLEGPSRS